MTNLNFLESVGIKSETIDLIYKNNNIATINDLLLNKDGCLSIILLLKKIGVTVIDDLLIYCLDIFNLDEDYVARKLKKVDIKGLVLSLEEDVFSIHNYL